MHLYWTCIFCSWFVTSALHCLCRITRENRLCSVGSKLESFSYMLSFTLLWCFWATLPFVEVLGYNKFAVMHSLSHCFCSDCVFFVNWLYLGKKENQLYCIANGWLPDIYCYFIIYYNKGKHIWRYQVHMACIFDRVKKKRSRFLIKKVRKILKKKIRIILLINLM